MTTGDFSRAPDAGRRVVLVTGATGFVGRAVLERLRTEAVIVRGVVRDATRALPDDVQRVVVRDVVDVDRADVAQGTDCVVHLAARVHMMRAASADPLREFRRVNVDGTLRLARAAAEAGARRFVFVSSIKVNGESGHFTAGDTPAPVDPYGVSKHEAEIGLRAVARETGMEVVVRPPLVYGPGVRAHFLSLMRIVDSGLPLPVGAIENRRSMVFVANLADFICTCMYAPVAANATFLVSDGVDLSTPAIVRRIAPGPLRSPSMKRLALRRRLFSTRVAPMARDALDGNEEQDQQCVGGDQTQRHPIRLCTRRHPTGSGLRTGSEGRLPFQSTDRFDAD
jgi:nucleoside-diphosphate-sugar epimerase